MTREPTASLGERVAFHRKRRGLSQAELGRLIGRSESWVSQVERDARKLDRLSVLNRLADALNVPTPELAPDVPQDQPAATEYAPYVQTLRLALTGHPALATALCSPAPAPLDIEHAREQVERAWSLVHGSQYGDAAPAVARLIAELEEASRVVPDGQRGEVLRLLVSAYQASASLTAATGDAESTWVAGDRAVSAADRSGDAIQVAAAQHRLALTLLIAGRAAQARHAASRAVTALEPRMSSAPVELVSVWGALHLALAVAAATDGDRREAWQHIDQARDAARRLGEDRNDFNTEFGPTNVELHAVAVAVELEDAGEALDLAAAVDASELSGERRARFLIDVARAYGQRRHTEDAVGTLLEADKITPEQVRDHPLVRSLIRDLVQMEGRKTTPELRALAVRAGVPG